MLFIFDLDGTLINTISDLAQACNHALSSCGFPTHRIEDYPRLVGNGINALIQRALPEDQRDESTVLRLREYFVPFYDEHNCDLTHPYDGIPQLLQQLKADGHLLAVASNKYQAATEKIVAQLFPGVFDVVLGERVGIARKPDPQIVYDILEKLSPDMTSPIVYMGDSLVDAATAQSANTSLSESGSGSVVFVACEWGFCTSEQLQSASPNHLIAHPSELLAILPTL